MRGHVDLTAVHSQVTRAGSFCNSHSRHHALDDRTPDDAYFGVHYTQLAAAA